MLGAVRDDGRSLHACHEAALRLRAKRQREAAKVAVPPEHWLYTGINKKLAHPLGNEWHMPRTSTEKARHQLASRKHPRGD